MIHSLAGGSFREKRVLNFAKVKICDGIMKDNLLWYILPPGDFNVGDRVVVPLGSTNARQTATIERIDKNVLEGQTPVPIRSAKTIISKIQ